MDIVIRRASYVPPPPPSGLTDGGTARITGSGFGTNTASFLALKDTIEAAANGTTLYAIPALSSAWGNAGPEGGSKTTKVSTASPFYGTRCLSCFNDGSDSGGTFGVYYDTGGTVNDLFIRDYIRINTTGGATSGQWKWIRFNASGGVTDGEPANTYIADWYSGASDFIRCTSTSFQRDVDWGTSLATWYEREVRIVPSSQGGANGQIGRAHV